MPVTKKKGAIFAIYADSPGAESSSAPASTSRGRRADPASPSRAPRRALSAVNPTPLRAFGSENAAPLKSRSSAAKPLSSSKDSKPLATRRPLGAASSAPLGSIRGTAPPPPKRQFGVFDGATSSNTLASTSSSSAELVKPLPSGSTASRSSTSTRRAATAAVDKENVLPANLLDSPAGRTRSKAPSNTASRGLAPALDFKKPLSAKGTKKAPLGMKRVDPGLPLGDVSDAYGASGDEPVGFRDVPHQPKPQSA